MTDRRCSLLWTVLTLALLAALPAAAAPASPAPAAAPDLEAAYAAIFAAPPADPAADLTGGTDASSSISVCCSRTYCCELTPPVECDGVAFGSVFTCAMRCSLC